MCTIKSKVLECYPGYKIVNDIVYNVNNIIYNVNNIIHIVDNIVYNVNNIVNNVLLKHHYITILCNVLALLHHNVMYGFGFALFIVHFSLSL